MSFRGDPPNDRVSAVGETPACQPLLGASFTLALSSEMVWGCREAHMQEQLLKQIHARASNGVSMTQN